MMADILESRDPQPSRSSTWASSPNVAGRRCEDKNTKESIPKK